MKSGGDVEHRRAADSWLLDALFAETPIGLGFWDSELRYRRLNDVLAAMNGLPVAEHLGRRVSDVLPQLGPELEERFARILATGEAQRDIDVTGETPAAPGVTRQWVASYFPVRDQDGEPIGIGATVVEVTSERRAAKRASVAERRTDAIDAQLRAIYAALPVGVGFVTPELRYERVNEALARMNGRPVEEHLGRTVHEILGEQGKEAERLVREVIARGEPMQFEAAVRPSASPEEERILEATYFPVVAAPDRLLGVGAVVRDVTERHALEQQRRRLLEQALEAKAVADEERRAANAARRRATFLATVTRRMAASLDYEATLREVAASAIPYIADWCLISALEPGGHVRIVGFAHRDPERERLARAFAAERPAQLRASVMRVLRSGKPHVEWDVTSEDLAAIAGDDERLAMLTELGVRHYGTWPVAGPGGQLLGALSLVLGDSGRRFTDGDLELAAALATRAGLHITNARLYTERSEIARILQAGLLPRAIPDVPGVEVASAFVAAGIANTVGGDFLDVFADREGSWTAVIGDVPGKGAAAAAITAGVRHTLRAAALVDPSPAADLDLLNRVLLTDPGAADFCTAICARLRPAPDRLEVTMANAGHPPALLLRHAGAIEPVTDGTGPVVGAVDDARFTDTRLELGPGDLLLLYTDGVTEARTSDLAAGERELLATLQRHRGEPAEAVVSAVKDCALKLQGGSTRDDIAVLGIRVPPC